jgi:hypothetical protein
MPDEMIATPTPHKRVPWNKGRLTGAKPPLRPKHVWSASFVAVTSSPSGSRTSPLAATRPIAQRSDKRKPDDPSNLN